jgi:hypothetical protein
MPNDPRLPPAPKLVVINTPGGARFSVAQDYQPRFQGLVNDLETGGYTIDPSQSGGYNPRFIAGTDTPSQHASGAAIDVNWRRNPHGQAPFDIPADVARDLAKKYGLVWGGDWTGPSRDAMHFEVPAQSPRNAQTQTQVAQAPAMGPAPGPVVPQQAPIVGPAGPTVDPANQARLALLLSGPGGGGSFTLPGAPTSMADALNRASRSFTNTNPTDV